MQDIGTLANEYDIEGNAEGSGDFDNSEKKRIRRKNEKKQRKMNKRKNNDDSIVICSQNYNGSSSREKLEETSREMRAQKIGIVFGQEGRRPKNQIQRWDTGEAFIAFGGEESKTDGDNRKKDGNFFVLNEKWKDRFVRGGKQKKRYCPRLVTIRVPVHRNKNLYLVNVHFPDSGKSAQTRNAYQQRFEEALKERKRDDIMIVMGDFNSSTGISEGEEDMVCGEFGIAHQDEPGRQLKATAAMYSMIDLVTWQEQRMKATYYGIGTRVGRQLDRAFVRLEHKHMVKGCVNAAMIVDSDHESVRLHIVVGKTEQPARTMRMTRTSKAVAETFGMNAEPERQARATTGVLEAYEKKAGSNETAGMTLMTAVNEAIDGLERKGRTVSGWCDSREWELTVAILARNRASKAYALAKTEATQNWLKETRIQVKKAKCLAKNRWLLQMTMGCNVGMVPGGLKKSDPAAVWAAVKKLRRGADKWRPWNVQNIQDENGKISTTPEENADNFQQYYNNLYDNDGEEGGAADCWYDEMEQGENEREWRAPQMFELDRAVRELKNTAPGLSGITAMVWKALIKNSALREIMLETMVECWNKERVPKEWLQYYMTVLEKKGNMNIPGNYRGIAMGETLSKVYTQILKHRLQDLYEGMAPEYANGFRRGRSRIDSIFAVLETLRMRKQAMLTGARPFSGPSLPFCLPVIAARSIVLSTGTESSG